VSTVGFPDSTVLESCDRLRVAIRKVGLEFPIDRITVNLAPADEGRLIPFGRLPGATVAPG
jgi:magnesium chelatase family protein